LGGLGCQRWALESGERGWLVDVLVYRPEEPRPVLDTGHHVSAKDKVEGRAIHPRALDVINLELDVRGDPRRLDGTQIVSEDLRDWLVRIRPQQPLSAGCHASACGYSSPMAMLPTPRSRQHLIKHDRRLGDAGLRIWGGPYISPCQCRYRAHAASFPCR
jgi:hypothetical protein